MQVDNVSPKKPVVMVRAWGDEPVQLFLYRIENNRCFVGYENAKRPIGLPNDQVFCLDLDKYAHLFTAFQQKDKRKLSELWAKMVVDDYACNKYQDVLESRHDQENITDTECAANRNHQ